MIGVAQKRQVRLVRVISNILAPIFMIKPAIAWYIGVFGKPLDPFVLTPEPAVSAPPLAFEWLVAIWLFVTAKFVFAALVIFCAWFGFQRLLDIYENQFEVSNKATK